MVLDTLVVPVAASLAFLAISRVATPCCPTEWAMIAVLSLMVRTMSLIEVIEDTAQRITRLRASREGREGMTAFLEKRKPNWITSG